MEIKGKTIFDFCKDKEVIKSIIGDYSENYYKSLPQTVIAGDIVKYASSINNKSLYDAALNYYNAEQEAFKKRCEEALLNGFISD